MDGWDTLGVATLDAEAQVLINGRSRALASGLAVAVSAPVGGVDGVVNRDRSPAVTP